MLMPESKSERGIGAMKKRTAALLAAAALVFALAAGCASSGSATRPSAAGGTASTAVQKAADSAETAPAQAASAAEKRKIVKSASLELETTDYQKVTSVIGILASEYGGYLEASSIEGKGTDPSGGLRTASYTVRVPSEKLEGFLNAASAAASVTRRSLSGKDVTQSYVDTQARLKSLQAERARLLELMEKAEKVADLLAVEQRLTEVQTQIEQMTASLKNMDLLVSFATVTVTVREVEAIRRPAEKSLGGQLGGVLADSGRALAQAARYLLIAVTAALPFAAVAGAVFAAVWFFRRRRRAAPPDETSGGGNPKEEPQDKTPPPPETKIK